MTVSLFVVNGFATDIDLSKFNDEERQAFFRKPEGEEYIRALGDLPNAKDIYNALARYLKDKDDYTFDSQEGSYRITYSEGIIEGWINLKDKTLWFKLWPNNKIQGNHCFYSIENNRDRLTWIIRAILLARFAMRAG